MHILKLPKYNLNSHTAPFMTTDLPASLVMNLEVVKSNPAARNYLLCSTND